MMISQMNNLSPFLPINLQKPTPLFCTSIKATHAHVPTLESSSPGGASSPKISRATRNQAQHALFDYLHCTRGFHFTDADHISNNSPNFILNLVSQIQSHHDVSRSLTNLLRFNPINEFEPFFESLGLSPADFTSFLPTKLFFLTDDHLLLDNFHVLCYYGIPRGKMGFMYKEAPDIFKYDYGVLEAKLRDYEKLGLSKSTITKLVSLYPSFLIGGVHSSFFKVLAMLKKYGFENDWIGNYLSDKSTWDWNKMIDTMEFLNEVGYSEERMGILFKDNPAILFDGSGKIIYVLAGRLFKLGLSMDEVFSLFLKTPQLLSEKYVKNLWQAVCFLNEIGMEKEDVAIIVLTHAQFLSSNTLKGPRTVLKNLKVKKDILCKMVWADPLKTLSLASHSKNGSTELSTSPKPSEETEKTTFLLKLGYTENSEEMFKASKKFRGRGDQLQERFDCLVQAGLDCNVVSKMIRLVPSVLNQTKDVLQKKIDCLRNELGYPLQSLATFPAYLCYDLERISHRFSMYVWLREKGAAKHMLSLSTILACSDARFVKYFVDVHSEGPVMWASIKKRTSSKFVKSVSFYWRI